MVSYMSLLISYMCLIYKIRKFFETLDHNLFVTISIVLFCGTVLLLTDYTVIERMDKFQKILEKYLF